MATIFWSLKNMCSVRGKETHLPALWSARHIISYSYVNRNEKFLRIMRISFSFRTEGTYYRDDYFLSRFSNLPIKIFQFSNLNF